MIRTSSPRYVTTADQTRPRTQACIKIKPKLLISRRRPTNFSEVTPHCGQGSHNSIKTVVKRPHWCPPSKKPEALGLGFLVVELRGLEPLTPTLPGTGATPEQAVQGHFWPVVGGVEGVTVVRVVVKIVVEPAGPARVGCDEPMGRPLGP